ncbi:uroporphyrinogen-III synthase [Gaoshiqia sediminis]|uniref:Uroporphyrinogen-III synthase n=1 Tax=Gaoshiqia sediminis TaxID=2986998 RepID=A0AA41YC11_9BACT|nr:uroporphyrinogen-III synthase [Gaoshiqia sediminis]MCW0482082.1 uroporphyrinogen-III synthase [Gaoshiqia sediminis]
MDKLPDTDILQGKIIICTYPKKDPDDFFEIISQLGAEVYYLPMIEVSPSLFQLQKEIGSYHWLVFTSKNGVSAFLQEQKPTNSNKMAALGEITAAELLKNGYVADFVGSGKSGADFAEELSGTIPPGNSVLLVLGNLAPDTLQRKLSANHPVDRVNVYQTIEPENIDENLLKQIEDDAYDLLIVSSPSAIKNLYATLKRNKTGLRLISIGKTTTTAMSELGLNPLVTAAESSYKALAEATISYFKKDLKNNTL